MLLSSKKSSSVITDSEWRCEVDPIVLYLFLLPCGLDSNNNGGCSCSEFFEEEDTGELGLPSTAATEKRVLEDGEIDELLVVTTIPPFSGFSNTLVPPYSKQRKAGHLFYIQKLQTLKRPLILFKLLLSTPFFFLEDKVNNNAKSTVI